MSEYAAMNDKVPCVQ